MFLKSLSGGSKFTAIFGSWSLLVTNIQQMGLCNIWSSQISRRSFEIFGSEYLDVNIWKSIFGSDKYPGGGAPGDWMEVVVSFAAGSTVLALPLSRPTAARICVFAFLYLCICVFAFVYLCLSLFVFLRALQP